MRVFFNFFILTSGCVKSSERNFINFDSFAHKLPHSLISQSVNNKVKVMLGHLPTVTLHLLYNETSPTSCRERPAFLSSLTFVLLCFAFHCWPASCLNSFCCRMLFTQTVSLSSLISHFVFLLFAVSSHTFPPLLFSSCFIVFLLLLFPPFLFS